MFLNSEHESLWCVGKSREKAQHESHVSSGKGSCYYLDPLQTPDV